MGTTILSRRLAGTAILLALATTRAEAQYSGNVQAYQPPQQGLAAVQQSPLASSPASAQLYGAPYASTAPRYAPSAQGQPPAQRTVAQRSPGQPAAAQYHVASAPAPNAPTGPAVAARYGTPVGQSNAQPYTAATAAPAGPPVSGPPGYAAPGTRRYTAMAYRNNVYQQEGNAESSIDSFQLNAPAAPDQLSQAEDVVSAPRELEQEQMTWDSSTAAVPPVAGYGCQSCQPGGEGAAANGSGGNCQYGYGANSFNYSTYDCYYGQGGYGKHKQPGGLVMMHGAGCNRWFGGAYGLLMERDSTPALDLAFAASGLAAGDFPSSSDVVLNTRDVDLGYQGGIEFRLGRTLGGSYNPSGGATVSPAWGLEGVYWTMFSKDDVATYIDGATLRTYSMIDPRGLEYDPDGAGALAYRPVAHYWDYAPPVADNTAGATLDDLEVRVARVRSQFQAQNVEVNLLKLPSFGGYAGDPCDVGTCSTGGSRFTCSKFLGFRFMHLDEAFMYGVDYQNTTTNATGYINHNIRAQNDLYGVQLGANSAYRMGSKWGVYCNAMMGLYGNDISVRQFMDVPVGGNVRFVQTGDNFDVHASKADVSTIGELRIGASYQYNAHCRFVGGWRLVGITGVALATEQIPSAFIDPAQLGRVNSSGSTLLHGLQAGVEFGY